MDEKIGLVRNGGIDIVLVALPGMKCNFFTGITGCPDFVFQAIYIPGTAYAKTVGNVFATVPAKNNWLELETCACMPEQRNTLTTSFPEIGTAKYSGSDHTGH
jgi:hypothetical protein